jgi:arylformamidase
MARRARWIDVSVPIATGMVHWPGDPEVRVERVQDMAKGDPLTASTLAMSAHSGTHVDAPAHFVRHGLTVDALPVEATVGRARVIAIRDPVAIRPAELERHRLRRGERVLFRTANSRRCWRGDAFVADYVHLSLDGARFLVARGVRTVGVDYLSVAGFGADLVATHRVLLEARVCVLEGLNLGAVRPGRFELLCLPLRIARGDGAPARALLRPLDR